VWAATPASWHANRKTISRRRKEQVERSREMNWLRIDAYTAAMTLTIRSARILTVLCQQCEQARASRLPVHATVHSAEA